MSSQHLPPEQRLIDLERADAIIKEWSEAVKLDWIDKWALRHLIAAALEQAERRGKEQTE